MIVKTNQEEFQGYQIDASNLQGGHAEKLFIPENATEIACSSDERSPTSY